MKYKIHHIIAAPLLVFALIVIATQGLFVSTTKATGTLSSLSDTVSDLTVSTVADHTILMKLTSGLGTSGTIDLSFDNATNVPAALDYQDVDIAVSTTTSSSTACSAMSYTEGTLVTGSSAPGTDTNWAVSITSGSNGNVHLMADSSGTTTLAAYTCLRIKIGTNATTGVTGTHQITNGSSSPTTISITTTLDTGSIQIVGLTNGVVNISATVTPSISFTITSGYVTLNFGSLVTTAPRFAKHSGDTSYTTCNTLASLTTGDCDAHMMHISTNASGGYNVTVAGSTLNSVQGATTYTITPITTSTGVTVTTGSDYGTEQFGINVQKSGDSGATTTIASNYGNSTAMPNTKFYYGGCTGSPCTTAVADTIASATGPAISDFHIAYAANISPLTEAGTYTTNLTYVATANF